jgi:TolB-like protein
MIRRIIAVFILVLLSIPAFAQAEKMRIAVFDLTSKSKEVEADSAMLSEMLRNEFIKTGRFEVVSREQTARIMTEAEFQGTGVTSEAGAIKIGKLLNVRRAIVGSVGLLGGTVFVTVQLFDLETGRFITAESMEAPSMKEIVSRMKSTVSVLTTAAYRAEGVAEAGPSTAEPIRTEPAPSRKLKPAVAAGSYPRLVNWVGYGTTAAGLGALAAGYFVFDKAAVTAYDAAIVAKAAYDGATVDFGVLWTEYQIELEAIENNTNYRLYAYIAGGVLSVGGIILAVLPAPKPVQALLDAGWSIAALPSGMLVTLAY